MFSVVDLFVCLLCLARAAWKIHQAVLQVSLGDYLGAVLGLIEAGRLLWSQRRTLKVIGGYLAKRTNRAVFVFRKWINRDSNKKGDMN